MIIRRSFVLGKVGVAFLALSPLLAASPVFAAEGGESPPFALTEERERCSDYDALRRPFFGDTHVHSTYSFDANSQDTRNTSSTAYRSKVAARIIC